MKSRYKNKLFNKVFVLIFCSMLIVFTIFGVYSFLSKKAFLLKTLEVEALNISKSISLISSNSVVTGDTSFLFEFNYSFIKDYKKLLNIVIKTNESKFLVIGHKTWKLEQSLPDELNQIEQKKINFKIVYSPIAKNEVFYYVYPINLSGINWGAVNLSLSLDDYNEDLNSLYLEYLGLLLIVIIISLITSYLIAKLFALPIVSFSNVAKSISNGNLGHRVHINRDDELGQLAMTFNLMLQNLEQTQFELKKSNVTLESRVKQRTDDLNRLNAELKELNSNLDLKVKDEINKRKRQEQLLIQQSRLAAMGEMISMIAHQWRQPLNALTILVQNIKLRNELSLLSTKDVNESVENSVMLINKMSETIDDFRNFFKPKKQKINFSVKTSIKNTIKLLEASFLNYNIQIELTPKDAYLVGYENEFSQVILNILSNAKDVFLERQTLNPNVKIDIQEYKDYVHISIEDNANGIDKNIIDKIFEPYFSTKSEKNGTGLGLYMSKVIIEQNMKGELKVQNSPNGAKFTIEIPSK